MLAMARRSMGLSDIESRLPPGFRFHPSDDELISFYLRAKVANHQASQQQQQQPLAIPPPVPATAMVEVVDLHEREPWELPEADKLSDGHWYFFSSRGRKYATGSRTNRATKLGYWKATGKDKAIHGPAPAAAAANGDGMVGGGDGAAIVIGARKTLVFYLGRSPNGRKTGWIMHEFRLTTAMSVNPPPPKEWVLCRVFYKGKGEDEQEGNSSSNLNIYPSGASCPPPPPMVDDGDHRHNQQLELDATLLDDQLVATLLQAQDTCSSFELLPILASAGEIGLDVPVPAGTPEMEMALLQGGSSYF